MFFKTCCFTAALALASAIPLHAVAAKSVVASAEGIAGQLATLPTGDQLLVEDYDGQVPFGGSQIELSGFSGIFGFGSEIAYVIVVDGEARIGKKTAGRGRMLLVPALGDELTVQRYDAGRLYDAMDSNAQASAPALIGSLADLAGGQKLGKRLGRLSTSNFNLATLNDADAELDRRERIGGTTVRNIRFGGSAANRNVEREIVSAFLDGLARRDAEGVAELLDPLPYGYSNLDDGGAAARLLMAQSLIKQRDWSAFVGPELANGGDTLWLVDADGKQAQVILRRTTEFAFVQAVNVE